MAATRPTSGSRSVALCLLLLASSALAEGPSRAEEDEAARQRRFREQYARASRAYSAKDYAAAIPDLQGAFAIQPVPQILFNIAQAYRRLEQYGSARVYFELYRSIEKDLAPERAAVLARAIAEVEERAQKAAAPRVIEKTKLVYVRTEKPLPRWLRPVGATAGVLGLGMLAGGAALLGLSGRCFEPPVAPSLECEQVYTTTTPGIALTAVGGGVLLFGAVTFGLSFKRPARPTVVPETGPGSGNDLTLPLLPQAPGADLGAEPPPARSRTEAPAAASDAEPPPAGWNANGRPAQ